MTESVMALDFDNGGQEVEADPFAGLPVPKVPGDGDLPDPEMDPEKFNAITAAALGQDDEEDFAIQGPPDGTAKLIAGYVNAEGYRFTTGEVRELRGRDEEAMERAFATGDLVRYMDTILRAAVVRVGDVQDRAELAKILDTLLIGDRDILLMQIRRSTYGDVMRLNLKCPHCDEEFQVDFSFADDVPIKGFTASNDLSQRLFDVQLPSGADAEIRLTDGRAQKLVYSAENLKKNDAEFNTLMLREVLSRYDGKEVKGVGPVQDMPSKDRRFLLEWLMEEQPGPQYGDVKQECPECTREFPLVVTPRTMFRG